MTLAAREVRKAKVPGEVLPVDLMERLGTAWPEAICHETS